MTDYALHQWRHRFADRPLSVYLVDARGPVPTDHVAMRAAVQPYVDDAMLKTINIPVNYDFDGHHSVQKQAYRLELNGCNTYRPNPVAGAVLESSVTDCALGGHCCSLDLSDD